jgi:adhesin/invasin
LCVEPVEPLVASKLTGPVNTGQRGAPNQKLPLPIIVKVLDDQDRPVPGVEVSFTVGDAGGSVSEPVVESGIDGTAQVDWVLGPTPGEQILRIEATTDDSPLEGSPLTAAALAVRPPPADLGLQTEPSGTAQNGVPFAQQPVVQVLDSEGQPVAEVQVSASIASGEGTLSGTTTLASDPLGIVAYTDLAIIGVSGPRTIQFAVTDPALSVTSGVIQVTAGTATQMTLVPPRTYEGIVGSPVTPSPSVQVKDAAGNPVAGVAVNFTTDRDASVSPTAVVSDEGGIAQVTSWTLGATANVQYSLTATMPSSQVPPVVFTATARPGAAGRLQIVTQPASSAQSGAPLSTQPVIQVTDQNGNPAPQGGVRVTATVASGSGDISNGVASTDGSGRASFSGLTITGRVGTYTISFSAQGLAGVTSSPITLAAGPATRLALISPAPTAQSRVPLSPQPVVQVQDASGNPVARAGLPVVAQLTGNARLDGTTTVTTDAAGSATFTDLTVTGAPGALTLGFSSPEVGTGASTPVTLPAPTAIELSKPAPASAQVATSILAAPAWVLKDAAGRTVSDVPVTLTASAGGTVTGSLGSGEGGGVQVDNWTLGPTSGPQTLTIAVTGTNLSNSVEVLATPGAPAVLAQISGHDPQQSGPVNDTLDNAFVVQVRDQHGNGVDDVAVQWQACEGGEVLTDATKAGGYSSVLQPTGETPSNPTFCTRATVSGVTPPSFDFIYTVTAPTTSELRARLDASMETRGPAPVPNGKPVRPYAR